MTINYINAVDNNLSALGKRMLDQTKKGLVGRHVAWLKKPRHGVAKVGTAFLVGIEHVVLSVSLVGIIPLAKGWHAASKISAYEKLKPITAKSPPSKTVDFPTDEAAFNHVNYFAIHDGQLWYKPKENGENVDWKLLYFDGLSKNKVPKKMKADGANLVVIDQDNRVHYKKVLKEKWVRGKYQAKDITEKDNWYDRWFSFPVFEKVYHVFASKKIIFPKDYKGWAASHRGEFNKYFEDLNGKKRPEFPMVTTLYVLPPKGNWIWYADPFLMNGLKHKIPGPKNPDFTPEAISASGSMILLMGYENKNGVKTPKLYTRLADFDTMRKNPILPGFWNKKSAPSQKWKELKLPLKGQASFGTEISIAQTGQGNYARRIMIKGTNKKGESGVYIKESMLSRWYFKKS